MKGLPRRNPLRRRPSDPVPQETQATIVAPAQAPPSEPLPAGLAPEDVAPTRPSFRDRGRLRRRLRYLRRVRELGFRDLGGLVFDLHRFARRNDELVLGKLAALEAVDRELRAIERVLDERRDIIELREPGVAACPRCGALHGTDAKFCPQCGTQFSGPLAMVEVGGTEAPSAMAVETAVPAPHTSPATPAGTPPPAAPVSAADAGATPVSGALSGGTPVPPAPAPTAPKATQQSSSDAPSAGGAEQPTQALPAVAPEQAAGAHAHTRADGDADGDGQPDATAMTSGDPLAPRDGPNP
jgi:ribosomal protein L40E